jgi:hypothetical protein
LHVAAQISIAVSSSSHEADADDVPLRHSQKSSEYNKGQFHCRLRLEIRSSRSFASSADSFSRPGNIEVIDRRFAPGGHRPQSTPAESGAERDQHVFCRDPPLLIVKNWQGRDTDG